MERQKERQKKSYTDTGIAIKIERWSAIERYTDRKIER